MEDLDERVEMYSSTVLGGSSGDYIPVLNNSTVDGADTTVVGNDAKIMAGAHRDNIRAGDNADINAGSGSDNVVAGNFAIDDLGSGDDTATVGDNAIVNSKSGSNSVTAGENATINLGIGSDSVNITNGGNVNTGDSVTVQYQNNISICSLHVEMKKWRLNGMGVACRLNIEQIKEEREVA